MQASALKGVLIFYEHILLLQEPVKGLPSLAPKKRRPRVRQPLTSKQLQQSDVAQLACLVTFTVGVTVLACVLMVNQEGSPSLLLGVRVLGLPDLSIWSVHIH